MLHHSSLARLRERARVRAKIFAAPLKRHLHGNVVHVDSHAVPCATRLAEAPGFFWSSML